MPWQVVHDDHSGSDYYWNTETNVTSWIRPNEMPSAMEPSASPAPTFQSSQDAQTAALQQTALRTLPLSKSPRATDRVVGWLQYLWKYLSVHNVQELDALDLATLKLWADPGVDQAMRMDPHLFAVLNQRLPKIASTSAGSTGGAGGGASNAGNVTGAEGPSTGKALKVFRTHLRSIA